MSYDIKVSTYDFKCTATGKRVRKGDAYIVHERRNYHIDAIKDLVNEKAH